jgi:hypothetical protein
VVQVFGSSIAEDLSERAHDEVGEVADCWPNLPDDGDELGKRLTATLVDYLKEVGGLPQFFRIEDAEAIEVTEELLQKAGV